jgi:hypothetical protein
MKKDTEADIRYVDSVKKQTKVIVADKNQKITLGALWDGTDFIPKDGKNIITMLEEQDFYIFIANNEVFGMLNISKNDPFIEKYRAAMDGNVIVIACPETKNVGLGDFWNGKDFIRAEDFK